MKFKAVSIFLALGILVSFTSPAYAGKAKAKVAKVNRAFADPNSCFQGSISSFSMREIAGDSRRNKIKLSIKKVMEMTDRNFDFADPINNAGDIYKLTLVSNGTAVLTLYMPGNQVDEIFWRVTSKGYDYRNKTAFPDGVKRLRMSDGPAGRGAVSLSGGGLNLNLNVLNLADLKGTNVAVVLESGVACWSAIYPPETQNSKNNAKKFTAKTRY
jgi:hypothetical protein